MIRHAQRHITKGNTVETQQRMLDQEIMIDSFDGRNINRPADDFARITQFDKSRAFGFGVDSYDLGRIAEENKN